MTSPLASATALDKQGVWTARLEYRSDPILWAFSDIVHTSWVGSANLHPSTLMRRIFNFRDGVSGQGE